MYPAEASVVLRYNNFRRLPQTVVAFCLTGAATWFVLSKAFGDPLHLQHLLSIVLHVIPVVVTTSIVEPDRMVKLSHAKSWVCMIILYVGVGFLYRLFHDVDFDLRREPGKPFQWYTVAVVAFLYLISVGYHLRMFHLHNNQCGKIYTLMHIMVVLFVLVLAAVANAQGQVVHFHHHFVALGIAYSITGKTPFALCCLALSLGVMTEGLATWGDGPIFYNHPGYCGWFQDDNGAFPSYNSITCQSNLLLKLKFCSESIALTGEMGKQEVQCWASNFTKHVSALQKNTSIEGHL